MWSSVFLTALIAGFGHGFSEPSGTGFCSWDSFLALNENSCVLQLDHHPSTVETEQHVYLPVAVSEGGSDQQTGWDVPRHCVREYCVYSNRKFAGGIVVVTNSENAKQISRLSDMTGMSGIPLRVPPFYATEIPGKGIGLVANRTIKRGEAIMVWQPSYMIHRKLLSADVDVSSEEQQYLLDAALQKLPAARRRAFSRQLGQFGGHRVSDILLTNSFQMDVGGEGLPPGGDEGHHLGNFPDVSRLNHDCRPNVAFRIDGRLAHHTHAVRDITVGEELTISYTNPFSLHGDRQGHILQSWGFRCTCPHCSMSKDEILQSDARLYEINEIEAELGSFVSNRVTLDMVRRLLVLYEEERLDAKVHGAYVLAALNYNLFGDAENARKYAQLAVEAGIIEFGPEADDVRSMSELADNPQGHFTWRGRIKA